MLQQQYYNKGLSKTQIEQIIKNYNLKYTTLTNEINLKLNSLIKTVLNDITPFLENIEYLSKQSKQLKEFENTKNRIVILENKLKEKTLIEKELQNNINSLKHEINELKEKEKEYEKTIKMKDELLLKAEDNKKNIQNTNNKNRKREKSSGSNKSIGFRSSSYDKFQINNKSKISKNEEEIKIDSNIINTPQKKQKQKNNFKWNKDNNNINNNKYMMNLQEITRILTGYHEKVMQNKNTQNINKFISSSNQKEEKKNNKNNKKRANHSFDNKEAKNDKKKRLSKEISKFKFNKDDESDKENFDVIQENKSYILSDEEIDEEIKELEIDEQNILNLINKINNL